MTLLEFNFLVFTYTLLSQNTAEILRLNVPMAMKVAFDGLKDSNSKTRDPAIDDLGTFEKVELSVLLCTDDFIRRLNKEWRDEDRATDVISMMQHTPGFQLPIVWLLLPTLCHSIWQH